MSDMKWKATDIFYKNQTKLTKPVDLVQKRGKGNW